MTPDPNSSNESGKDLLIRRAERAERLLAAMHPVFSHDLPNQLVIVQSLIGLLDMEERERLGPDGQEYLQRLSGAAQRAGALVHFLRDMARLSRLEEGPEELRLSTVARELTAQSQHLFPERKIRLELRDQTPWVKAGRRALHQALLECMRCGLEQVPAIELDLLLQSQPLPTGGASLELSLQARGLENVSHPGRLNPMRPDQRLEWLLARELVATWGGDMRLFPGGGYRVLLTFPMPTTHG